MIKIELTDDEVTTILVALDNYGDAKRLEWAESRDDADLSEAGSAEWCWQKLFGAQQQFRNSTHGYCCCVEADLQHGQRSFDDGKIGPTG